MKPIHLLLLISLFAVISCKKDPIRQPDTSYHPIIQASDFTNPSAITNPYSPFETGKKYIYEGQTNDGLERVEVQRLDSTKTILGINCIVVLDRAYLNGKLIEETYDWYAQDNAGNVWYFGEAVDNYDGNGHITDHHGSWEAGVDGAQPGISMLAVPHKGEAYRQEYYFNEAEDEAEILETELSLTTPFGTFQHCIKTKEFTALEPDLLELKYYAPGVGLLKEENPADGEQIYLIEIQ